MSDRDVLVGYFFASRYITKAACQKYGLDSSMYEKLAPKSVTSLKERLKEWIAEPDFCPPTSGQELRDKLGDEFEWVRSSLDARP